MHILERYRANSPLLRIAQALLCAVFLLNLAGHFSHQHDAQASASSERLTCAHCCSFTGVVDAPKSPEVASKPVVVCGVVIPLAEVHVSQRPRTSQLPRGPPSIRQATSLS